MAGYLFRAASLSLLGGHKLLEYQESTLSRYSFDLHIVLSPGSKAEENTFKNKRHILMLICLISLEGAKQVSRACGWVQDPSASYREYGSGKPRFVKHKTSLEFT